ncbi:hypothetical protein ACJU26_08700 [Acidithiobacillus sp. M4-SHS-6]|uniref:deoxynucleotide monophosphate kinase family protein n=1 Tax=Acidithiobacillus sp. M4-SHS-6 TaxID=3383024 RepID=UPI0039BEAAE8
MLIGLMGKARSGKDTLAGLLKGFDFERLSFADRLYREASEMSGLSLEYLVQNKDVDSIHLSEWTQVRYVVYRKMADMGFVRKDENASDLRIRTFLQDLGTARRMQDEGYWVNSVMDVITDNPQNNYVITDVRFPNEYFGVQQKSGVLVRILRKNLPAIGDASGHSSETALDTFIADYTIHNDGEPMDMIYQLVRFPDGFFRRLHS